MNPSHIPTVVASSTALGRLENDSARLGYRPQSGSGPANHSLRNQFQTAEPAATSKTIRASSDPATTARNEGTPVPGPVRDGMNRLDNSMQMVAPMRTAVTTVATATRRWI